MGQNCSVPHLLGNCNRTYFDVSTPLGLVNCDPGYYCPFIVPGCNATYPQFCPPTVDCMKKRLSSSFCEAQGKFEPTLCLPGFYCPTQFKQIQCDEGFFCPRGSVAPTPCPLLSYCPPQTEKRRYYGGLLVCGIVDVLFVLAYYVIRYRLEPAAWRARRAAHRARTLGSGGSPSDSSPSYELTSRPTDALLLNAPGDDYAELSGDSAGGHLSRESPDRALSAPPDAALHARRAAKALLREGFLRSNHGLRLNIAFEGLTLTLPPPASKTILSGVSGAIRPGHVTAIMGPSGAGKTTFLSVLMGKLGRTSGELRINGTKDEMYRYKKMTGFVPQDDTMMTELTVRENIAFAARTRLPRTGWTAASINLHVDAVIDALGLSECADTLSSAVSGGQRKRCNIGIELAMAPAAIFLDEPTSGLDATAALEVCQTLRDIADLGLTVVAVIHQPRLEIFKSFDDLLLLAPGGKTVFIGPQSAALPYFVDLGLTFPPGYNPADVLLDFIGGEAEACVGACEGGMLKVLARKASVADGGDSPQKRPPGTPSTPLPSVGSQLAQHWFAEGRLAALLASSDGNALSPPRVASVGSLQAASLPLHEAAAGDSVDGADARFDPVAGTADRGATFLRQMYLCHNRSIVQQYRTVASFALEVGVAVLAGTMMGAASLAVPTLYVGILKVPYVLISPSPIEPLLPSIGLFVSLAIGIAASPAGVKTFGEERPVYFREASAGHNRLAYYIAKSVAVLYRLTIGSFHFVSCFHILATPYTSFDMMYGQVWVQYFCVYGLAAVTSMVVARENAALLGVIISLIVACLCGYGPSLVQGRQWGVGWVQDMAFTRWSSEAWFGSETAGAREHFMVDDVSAQVWGYTLDRTALDFSLIILIGCIYRVVAFGLLVGLNREKQR